MESFNDVFTAVKARCKSSINEASYNLFIAPIELGPMDGQTVTLYAPNDWARGVIEYQFLDLISKGFEEILGFTVVINLKAKPAAVSVTEPAEKKEVKKGSYDLTFDTFIVGSSNKLAHAAAYAVSQKPSTAYNPLFIYGDSGLGKTHLLNAIKTEIHKNYPDYNIVYVDGETFTNEIIAAIRENDTASFQNKYRKSDVLLVDDIQFIAGKTQTQEEFFHTFNALHNSGKQIVLASDRSPKEIKSLEDRLRTRFEWGLMADIQAPDFETRCAIINRKAERFGLNLKNDVVTFIASKVQTNIRQLEGVVKKLNALQELEGKPPVIATAQVAVKDILNETLSSPAMVDKIIAEVAKVHNCTPADLTGQSHKTEFADARKMAMYIIKEVCGMTMKDIGDLFGGRNHSTVVYNLKVVGNKIKSDRFYHDTVEDIIKNVKTI